MNKEILRPGVAPGGHVLHRRLGLDGDHRHYRDPVRPGAKETHQRAVRIMAIAHHAAGFGEHGAEFGIGERDGRDDHGAQNPGPYRVGPGKPGRPPGAE